MLAAKASLAIRVDALGEGTGCEMGIDHRAKLEARLRHLEDGQVCSDLLNELIEADSLIIPVSVRVLKSLEFHLSLNFAK